MARPRIPVGAHGVVHVAEVRPGLWRARTLHRFPDGRARQVQRVREGACAAPAITALELALCPIEADSPRSIR